MISYSFGHGRGYRSNYRGRGGRPFQLDKRTRTIAEPLGQLLTTIKFDELDLSNKSKGTGITGCKYVASYNLTEDLQKTIFVPGQPPVWTPLPGSTKLQEDNGEYYRDDNAARFPDFPLEPAVKAIFVMNESFDTSKVDIFNCSSTLGDILRFARGEPQPFTFIVQKIGSTLFFVRRNLSPTELIEDVRGYGHSFPEAYTTWNKDVKGSSSHQRIVEYSFGGLRFLVRFEVDGYVLGQADDSTDDIDASSKSKAAKKPQAQAEAPVEDLLAGLLSSKARSVEASGLSMEVHAKGSRTPQSSIFDLKTRSVKKNDERIMEEQLPRLWIRQISKFVLAFHKNGVFEDPNIQDVTDDVVDWEQRSCHSLQRMASILSGIVDVAMTVDGGKLEVRGDESSTMQLRELSAEEGKDWNAVSDVLQEEWKRNMKQS